MVIGWKIISGHDNCWVADELSLSETRLAGDQEQNGSFQVQFFASHSNGDALLFSRASHRTDCT